MNVDINDTTEGKRGHVGRDPLEFIETILIDPNRWHVGAVLYEDVRGVGMRDPAIRYAKGHAKGIGPSNVPLLRFCTRQGHPETVHIDIGGVEVITLGNVRKATTHARMANVRE
jgi:hypothetical protein